MVISDNDMPGALTGLEAVSKFREWEKQNTSGWLHQHIYCISSTPIDATTSPFNGSIPKPISLDLLNSKLDQVLVRTSDRYKFHKDFSSSSSSSSSAPHKVPLTLRQASLIPTGTADDDTRGGGTDENRATPYGRPE
jgi:hypothetical protein